MLRQSSKKNSGLIRIAITKVLGSNLVQAWMFSDFNFTTTYIAHVTAISRFYNCLKSKYWTELDVLNHPAKLKGAFHSTKYSATKFT